MNFCKDCGTQLEMLSVEGQFLPYCISCKAWILPNQKLTNLPSKGKLSFNIPSSINNGIERILRSKWFWTFWIGFIIGELAK